MIEIVFWSNITYFNSMKAWDLVHVFIDIKICFFLLFLVGRHDRFVKIKKYLLVVIQHCIFMREKVGATVVLITFYHSSQINNYPLSLSNCLPGNKVWILNKIKYITLMTHFPKVHYVFSIYNNNIWDSNQFIPSHFVADVLVAFLRP